MNASQLTSLASEIREFLIGSVSCTGGHLASNLGAVELTIALHAVMDAPRDKIIWDVGHQSYVHKMLTGRMGRFGTLRQRGGISGFPKPGESDYDAFGTGHGSTSVSAALGLAVARDLRKRNDETGRVIAVIGDGAMTGGLAYEAINNAGRAETDLLVVINDNNMSISENVGAISKHLNEIRTAPIYLGAKKEVHTVLDHIPVLGGPASRAIERAKDAVKYLLVPGVMFEELGFKYFGPVDGHDIKALMQILEKIKLIKGPVMLHAITVKGKGYERAESRPANYHGVEAFRVETGRPECAKARETYSDVFGEYIAKRAAEDKRIVAVTAAMPDGTGLCGFAKKFPKRFFDVGIAEAHAVTFAAGLAMGGMRPVVAVYSTFLQRAYDQILHDVCLQNLPVVFAVDRAGICGQDGETHQGIYDLSFLSHIPGLTVAAPKNKAEFLLMLDFALGHDGPVAIRYPKGAVSNAYQENNAPVCHGISERLADGERIALVSVGAMMDQADEAVRLLREAGRSPALFNARFVKPLDMGLVSQLASFEFVFAIEDNIRPGGYGARLLEALHSTGRFGGVFHGFAY
ncbi:MAG: 1-deoxy-D-xylulose-5-phosphate synthase, partial [Defluviitaleaceae bacterium]|nr:1-deoxy-D-xylulose-5-phosphate synthase [Defluviitaleaceae bacterium]